MGLTLAGMNGPILQTYAIHFGGESMIDAIVGNALPEIPPVRVSDVPVAKAPVPIRCGFAMTDTGIYFGSGIHLWRYRW